MLLYNYTVFPLVSGWGSVTKVFFAHVAMMRSEGKERASKSLQRGRATSLPPKACFFLLSELVMSHLIMSSAGRERQLGGEPC